MKCWSSSSNRSVVGFSGLLIAFLLLLGVSTPSFAASTGDLDLSGTVSATCDITVTPIAGVADNLPFGSPQSDLVVGSVSETCNDADGYTLSAVSSNSSVLLPLGTSPDSLAYTFRYGGVLVDLTAGSRSGDRCQRCHGLRRRLQAHAHFLPESRLHRRRHLRRHDRIHHRGKVSALSSRSTPHRP